MNGQKTASVWVPWVCIPLLLLFNFQIYLIDNISFNLTLFHIPAVVALTYRYGWHGFVAALIGSAPLLISIDSGPFSYGGRASLYLIVAHSGWLTLSKGWFDPEKSGLPRTAFMILLLLGCSIALSFDGTDTLRFNWWGITLLYYAFFVLGLRGVKMDRWLVIAGLLTFIGITLSLIKIYGEVYDYDIPRYLYPTENLRLTWVLNQPGEFLTLLVFFGAGKWIRDFASTAEPSAEMLSSGLKLAMGTSILYLLGPMWQGLVVAVSNSPIIGSTLHAISPEGSYYILPILALSLSMMRRNGVLIATILVGTYYLLYGVADWSAGSSFRISPTDFAIAITFAMLGTRIARLLHGIDLSATASLLPSPSAGKQATLKPDDWARQHDEISNTVRRVMFSLLAYSLFCGLTLASTNDASLFGVGSEIALPIAGTSIDYTTFLTVGPLILIGLIVYLHLFLQSAMDLGKPQGANPLPYLFNMENSLAVILSGFLHYWLPVLLLFQFAWKATPQPMAGFWLGLASTGMGIAMAYLHMARMSAENGRLARRITRVMFFAFGLLFAIQLASGGAMLKRPLMLDDAKFEGRDLSGFDFREASLVRANLKNTKLSGANLLGTDLIDAEFAGADLRNVNFRNASLNGVSFIGLNLNGSDLRGADLTKAKFNQARLLGANLEGAIITGTQFGSADLEGADLRGVYGIDCKQFVDVKNLDKAFRNEGFSCGAGIPKPPTDEKERDKTKLY